MAYAEFAIAAGYDQTTLTNIEDIWLDPPSVMPDQVVSEQLPIERRVLSGHIQRNGKRTVEWLIEHVAIADYGTYLDTYFPGGVASAEVTILTLSERGLYVPCNAIATRPVPTTHHTYWHGGDIRDLRQVFFDVVPLASVGGDGLLLENGLGLMLETGEFLLLE